MKRRTGWIACAISSLLCALLLEGVFRVQQPAVVYLNLRPNVQEYCTRPDPVLQYRNREGFTGRFRTGDFSTTVRINSRGLRDREVPYARTPGGRRILLLGDSFAFGWGVEAEQTVAKRLEAHLPGTEVLNAGCSGWSTRQEVDFFRIEGRRYRPDTVLLLFCPNDPAENAQRYRFDRGRLRLADEDPAPAARADRWLMKSSALYGLGKRVLQKFGLTAGGALPATIPADLWLVEEDLLRRLIAACRDHNADLVIAYVPGKGPGGRPIHLPGYEDLADFAQREAVPLLDLTAPLSVPDAPVHFPRDEHWTPEGHAAAAAALADWLVRQGTV